MRNEYDTLFDIEIISWLVFFEDLKVKTESEQESTERINQALDDPNRTETGTYKIRGMQNKVLFSAHRDKVGMGLCYAHNCCLPDCLKVFWSRFSFMAIYTYYWTNLYQTYVDCVSRELNGLYCFR